MYIGGVDTHTVACTIAVATAIAILNITFECLNNLLLKFNVLVIYVS